MDHPWVSGSAAHHRQAVTKQSELAHQRGPSRRPLLHPCTVIHLLVTLFPHNELQRHAARDNALKKKKRNENSPCCEFQSVTSAVCVPCLRGVWRSSELRLTLQVDKLRSCNEKYEVCRWKCSRCEVTPRVLNRTKSLFLGLIGQWRIYSEL